VQFQVLERDGDPSAETPSPLLITSEVPDRGHYRLGRRLAVLLAVVVGLVVLGVLLYASSIHAAQGNSDGATAILEGKALRDGNLTLNHWALSLDSFWSVDVPLYAIAVLFAGVRPQLLHLVPTIVALGVICVGVFIARLGRRGWSAVLAAGTVVVLVGFPTKELAANFLMGPLHVTTAFWCLLAFVALSRGHYGWAWLFGVGLLAFGMLGDFQAVVLGIVPVFLAGIVVALRNRNWRAGAAPMTAALASVVVAEVIRRIALVIGTYFIAPANPLASFHQMALNIVGLLGYGADMFGVGIKSFSSVRESHLTELAHTLGLGLVLIAVSLAAIATVRSSATGVRSVRRRLRTGEAVVQKGEASKDLDASRTWFDDVLVFGFFGACAIYVSLSLVSSSLYDRYLTSVVIFGSILAARLMGRLAETAGSGRSKAALAGTALLVATGYLATFASGLTASPPVQASSALVSYLEGHHLSSGIGDYWSSSVVTVESSDAVVIRPVTTEPGTRYLGRYMRQTTSSWYATGFEFFVYNTALAWNSVDAQTAAASFGPPLQVASVGTYRILTWGHNLSVPDDGRFVKYVPTR